MCDCYCGSSWNCAEDSLSIFFHTSRRDSDERGNGDAAEAAPAAGPDDDEYGGSTDEDPESAQPTPTPEPQPGTVRFLALRAGKFSSVAERVQPVLFPLSSEELWQLQGAQSLLFFHRCICHFWCS